MANINDNLIQFWAKMWKLIFPVQKRIKRLISLILIMEIFQLAGPYFLKYVIDYIVDFKAENINRIIFFVFCIFVMNQINSIFGFFAGKSAIKISADTENDLIKRSQEKMVYLDLNYHERENTGNKISKIRRGVDKIQILMDDVFWQVAPTLIQVLLTTLILYLVDWRFGLIFSFFIPTFVLITWKLNTSVNPYRKNIQDGFEDEGGKMAEAIININTVKSFVQEEREVKELKKITDRLRDNIIKMFNVIFRYNIGRDLIISSGEAFIILFGIYLVWNGWITVGSLVFVITISQKALVSLYRISRLYDRIMDSSEAIDRLYELSLEQSEIVNIKNGIKPKDVGGEIEFKNVSFKYKDASDSALKNINLKIGSGCVTALVGPSGGGKTTVARMVYRHYDPLSGEVMLDGISLKKYDLYSFRKFISIVPQEVEIFNMSIKDNISYAKPNASLREVEAAARIANAEEFILKMNDKYDTQVGERGIKLSGGQRQRVGIARAILANPKILIFDEATSSLDSYSEKLIQNAMDKISKGRTTIIIAHRLSTIKKADKIVVLENGKVAEIGSHIELSKLKGGLYSKLINLQSMGDID